MLKELKETMYKYTAAIEKFIKNTMNKFMLINLATYRQKQTNSSKTTKPQPRW